MVWRGRSTARRRTWVRGRVQLLVAPSSTRLSWRNLYAFVFGDLDQSRRSAARLFHVTRTAIMHFHPRAPSRFRIPRRCRSRCFDDRSRHFHPLGIANHHVTARRSSRHVHPNVVWLGHLERQIIIVRRAFANQHFEAFDVHGAIWFSLAAHVRPSRYPRARQSTRPRDTIRPNRRASDRCAVAGHKLLVHP